MRKATQTFAFAAFVLAALSAGMLSAHQLYRPFQTTCSGFCTKKTGCPNILGCACVFNNPGATVGKCEFIAARPAQ